MNLGTDYSENVARAELLFRIGQREESIALLMQVHGCIETYREQPEMMADWEPEERAALEKAWEELGWAWSHVIPEPTQRPPPWN